MEQTDESGELVERVAALDIGKATVMACIRVPHEDRSAAGARRSASTARRPARCWRWPAGCTATG